MRNVVWFSAGAASAVTAKIVLADDPDAKIVYIETNSEHSDNTRFLRDCETWYGTTIETISSKTYQDIDQVFEDRRWLNGPHGALCTVEMKKKPRYAYQHPDDAQSFGYTIEERSRAERFVEQNPGVTIRTPLIEHDLTKADTLAIIDRAGIELPAMYRLGYHNNNCIGCVKGGKGYWNKVRVDFPDVFARRAAQERTINASCISGTFLDELDPSAGHYPTELSPDCSIACAIAEIAIDTPRFKGEQA